MKRQNLSHDQPIILSLNDFFSRFCFDMLSTLSSIIDILDNVMFIDF